MKLYFLIWCLILFVSCNENKRQNDWDEFHKGNSMSNPEVRISYYDGDSRLKQIIRFNKFGQQDGIFQTFYENGNIKRIEYYIDGVPNGLKTVFYENGTIESVENYKDGLKDGCFYGYYETGEKRYEIKWRNNKRISAVEYDMSGNVVFQE